MSSHREAPQISKDPTADSTDVYAFVSPDHDKTVTLIANYIPLQDPDGGPNFYEFDDNTYYDINIDNTGTGTPAITYRFEFTTTVKDPGVFLYNTGQINGIHDATFNRPQSYTLTRIDYDQTTGAATSTTTLGTDLPVPPCNIGPLSIPYYPVLGIEAIKTFSEGGFTGTVFAGQRAEGFYVDLGAIFDLGNIRPIQSLNAFWKGSGLAKMADAINSTANLNVHSLALQIPIDQLTVGKNTPTDATASTSVIGVWTSASRPGTRTYPATNSASATTAGSGTYTTLGAYEQVSRLGNPLVNEALIGIGYKDAWNNNTPSNDGNFLTYFSNPVLAELLPTLYPTAFPNLKKYNAKAGSTRPDIEAILLTGIPSGIIKGFQNELTAVVNGKPTYADMLRLNVAIPPAKKPSNLGLLGGDVAGFPNGRRVFDDVTSIELKALAGLTLPLVEPTYKVDAAVGDVSSYLTSSSTDKTAKKTEKYMSGFPYLGRPHSGGVVGALSNAQA